MFDLNDALRRSTLDPAETLVLRNATVELGQAIYWIADERPELFRAYQHTQGTQLSAAMSKAKHLVSCIAQQADKAVFVQVYDIIGRQLMDASAFGALPEHQELAQHGYEMLSEGESRMSFDLVANPALDEWKGRLVIGWPGGARSWWRYASRNRFPLTAITEESIIRRRMPDWRNVVLTWPQLSLLPASWKANLSQWRGVYFIHDQQRQLGYVGSACGGENLMGRWLSYAASGHGGNKLLRQSNPNQLRFSILERTSPDLDSRDVIALEQSWKERLHTRSPHGLNDN